MVIFLLPPFLPLSLSHKDMDMSLLADKQLNYNYTQVKSPVDLVGGGGDDVCSLLQVATMDLRYHSRVRV